MWLKKDFIASHLETCDKAFFLSLNHSSSIIELDFFSVLAIKMTIWSFVVFSFFPKTHIQSPSQKEFKILTPSLICSKWVKIFQKWLVLTWSCRRCPLFRWDGRDLVSRMGLELMPLKGEKLSWCQSIRVHCRYCHGMWDPRSLWTFLETASLLSAPEPSFFPSQILTSSRSHCGSRPAGAAWTLSLQAPCPRWWCIVGCWGLCSWDSRRRESPGPVSSTPGRDPGEFLKGHFCGFSQPCLLWLETLLTRNRWGCHMLHIRRWLLNIAGI